VRPTRSEAYSTAVGLRSPPRSTAPSRRSRATCNTHAGRPEHTAVEAGICGPVNHGRISSPPGPVNHGRISQPVNHGRISSPWTGQPRSDLSTGQPRSDLLPVRPVNHGRISGGEFVDRSTTVGSPVDRSTTVGSPVDRSTTVGSPPVNHGRISRLPRSDLRRSTTVGSPRPVRSFQSPPSCTGRTPPRCTSRRCSRAGSSARD